MFDPVVRDPAILRTALRDVGARGHRTVLIYPVLIGLLWLSSESLANIGTAFWVPAVGLVIVGLLRFEAARRLCHHETHRFIGAARAYAAASLATAGLWGLLSAVAIAKLGMDPAAIVMLVASSALVAGSLGSLAQFRWLMFGFISLITVPISLSVLLFWQGVDGMLLIALGTLLYAFFVGANGTVQSREYWDRVTANHLLKMQTQALHEARETAESAGRAKGDFLASMSHEIRTPMNGVLGVSDLLRSTALDKEQRELLKTLEDSGRTLLRIIDDILDYSRVEAGRLELEAEDLDPGDCAEHVGELLAAQAEAKGLALDVLLDPGLPQVVSGDAGRIEQVLLNLGGNAIKFTEHGSVCIEVRCEQERDGFAQLRYSVTDTGIGIPEDKRDRLFRPFSQVDASMHRRHGGSGLGLAICHRLLDVMGGKLGFESVVAQGSTFHFTVSLPVRRGARSRSLRVKVPVQVVSRRSATREALLRLLEMAGSPARAGEDLIALTQVPRVDLVLVEIDAEDEGMAAQLPTLKAKHPGVRVVVVSSGADRPELRALIADVAEGYLLRPVRRAALEAVLWPEATMSMDIPTAALPTVVEINGRVPRILGVEDNPINQMLAKRFLERAGYESGLAVDGQAGVDAVESAHWDAVLMDCQMPGMDGIEATEVIRAREEGTGRHLPIIAMTAHALEEDRRRALDAGMDAYLTKPLQPEEMIRVLERQIMAGRPAKAS